MKASRSGQSSMEYITTYGWAILIILIVGVVIWQLGLLDINSRFTPGVSGFSMVVPVDWKVEAGSCTMYVEFLNGAGEGITNATAVGGSDCDPTTVPAGGMTTCSRVTSACGSGGTAYNEFMTVTYRRSSDGQQFQTAGNVWGNVEG